VSDSVQKLFPISGTAAVAHYGFAEIGGSSLEALIAEFEAQLTVDELDPVALPDALGAFLNERLMAAFTEDELDEITDDPPFNNRDYAGLLVAHYDSDGIGRINVVTIPGPHVAPDNGVNTTELGFVARGDGDVVSRLIDGVALEAIADQVLDIPQSVIDALRTLAYTRKLPTSMYDAMEFATFLVRTTIDMQRFSAGTIGSPRRLASCGGAVRALSLSRTGVRPAGAQTGAR